MIEPAAAASAPPRIAFVATTALTLRSFLLPYAAHLRGRGWEVHGIAAGATRCELCRDAFTQVHDVDWSRNPLHLHKLMAASRQVAEYQRRWRFDLVHVHTPVASFVTRMALRERGKRCKLVYTAHGFHFHAGGGAVSNAVFTAVERAAGRWTDRLIVINTDDERAALDVGIVPAQRLRRMPGIGIDLAAFAPAPACADTAPFRSPAGADRSVPTFLMVAEFNPGKRHCDLVRALAVLERPGVQVAFAGVGPEMSRVRRLANTLGVGERVHFLGYRRDISVLLHAATAFVLCSDREGLPVSMMEAMAAGTPAIGTRIRGISDLLHGAAGLLVPVADPAALAAAMREVLDDPQGARARAAEARRRIEGFSVTRLLAMHDELYDELLREARR